MSTFIDLVKDGAIKAQAKFGICASLTIAQAILESGWGKYSPGNNLFGIKWQAGCGYDKQTLLTTEYINGKAVKVNDFFRKYNSFADSLYDHAQFLVVNSRYKNLLGLSDYKQVCNLIQQDGYATDPNYAKMLIQIIEQNKLNIYDKVLPVKEEIEMVGAVVVYGTKNDQANAELIADALGESVVQDSQRKYSFYKNHSRVICVGAVPQGGMPFTTYATTIITGTDRFDTADRVNQFIKNGCK